VSFIRTNRTGVEPPQLAKRRAGALRQPARAQRDRGVGGGWPAQTPPDAFPLVSGAAILEDKARMIRGQATSINVQALLDVAEIIRQRDRG
jgi:hypothetical protein